VKITDWLRFPHPVLAMNSGGDYLQGALVTSIDVSECATAGALEISGTVGVTHREFLALIERGDLRCVLVVSCLDTYLVAHYPIGVGAFNLNISNGALRGTVLVRAVLQVASAEVIMPKEGLNSEFDPDNLRVTRGGIAGIGEEFRFEAGLDKLVPLESVFRLVSQPGLEAPRFELITDKQAVEIAVPPNLYDEIVGLRNSTGARNILLSALYLPCVIELLAIAHADPRPELRWFQAIESRCRQLGVELDGKDLADKAQRLLGDPLGGLYKAVEGMH
jgi:hypothetical protein